MTPETKDARRQLVAKHAEKYGLDVELVCAVIDHETGGTWDVYTTRNEDEFFARYIMNGPIGSPSSHYRIPIPVDSIRSQPTEARTRAMSFGLMQVIGETAREFGFAGRYITSLCDPEIGLDFGCKVLKSKIDGAGNVHDGLMRYNGGNIASYADEVLALVDSYRG